MTLVTALAAGTRAPEFSLPSVDGTIHRLDHGGAETALLVFFKNTCPTCMLAFPYLQRLYERLEGAPLRFWGISQDGPAETEAFGRQFGATFPLLVDGDGYPVSNAYGLTNVPTLFLLEPEGKISRTSTGFFKTDLEGLAAELRNRFRVPGVTPLFVDADGLPELKPG